MKAFSVQEAVTAMGGVFRGAPEALNRVITSVVSDSRQISEGTMFAAFKGARVDGHDYMADCLKRGAAVVISEREPKDETEEPCIVVDSTLRAAGAMAAWYRSQFDIPIVGITGSVGKTTTKEMVATVLGTKFKTHKTQKNFNNELGVPRTLINMPEDTQTAVVEMGISDFGEMTRLTNMVKPTIAIITVIGDAHLEFLHDHAGVLKAKTEIFNSMGEDTFAIINGDDETLKDYIPPVPYLKYGKNPNNDFIAENIEYLGEEGMRMTIRHHGTSFECRVPAYGTHLSYAVLVGACVGWKLGMTNEEIAKGVTRYETVGSRAKLIRANGMNVISDCYNANPSSVKASVNSLMGLEGRKTCILGDMLELGPKSAQMHYGVGENAAKQGVDLLIACGELSAEIIRGAKEAGLTDAYWYATKEEMISALDGLLKQGDSVLVKASHSMAFDTVVEKLIQ